MLGGPVQVAYAVDDVEASAVHFSEAFGAGPFYVAHHPPMACLDQLGQPGLFCHSSAYGQWGAVQVELVAIEGEARRGLHHVAHFVASIDTAVEYLGSRGFPLHLSARTPNGTRFAFCDARTVLGHLIELYEPTPGIQRLYRRVREASVGWDGADPVRPMPGG
ncbi:MAG: VOC family protein [Acidobacteriota bacterium]|nr:VOC family protein [Acidobacteriota bacterium]